MLNYYECVNADTSKSNYKGETLMNYEVADMIEDCIDNAPTADVVEAVRCKDCEHWGGVAYGFVCRKCGCVLHVGTIEEIGSLSHYDCPNCGEEPEGNWVLVGLEKKGE
jgi:hypothetical protein